MSDFQHKTSALYTETVQTMRKLLAAEGADHVLRAFADVTSETRKAQWIERHKVSESGGRLCVQRLLGKVCSYGYQGHDASQCHIPGADHQTLWLRDGKPYAYVSQPYGMSWRTFCELHAFCQQYGLKVEFDTWPSWHFPGSVLTVIVTRADPSA